MYLIVKDQSQPTGYLSMPEQLIVRHQVSWDVIERHLEALRNEGLVEYRALGKLAVYLTAKE